MASSKREMHTNGRKVFWGPVTYTDNIVSFLKVLNPDIHRLISLCATTSTQWGQLLSTSLFFIPCFYLIPFDSEWFMGASIVTI